ncbi:phosphotransferase enzyme family protein [Paenibacillus hodogayensis]|uniref:Phosphotransferase enzyme family protein n=1 Tax=Paenibacillus hodogayensis TaxID=279208 RepID=A0ABV5W3I5_9BACL
MKPEIAQLIMKEYGIPEDTELTLLHGGTANRNYLMRRKEEKRILRMRNKKYSTEPWIAYEEQYLYYLQQRGIPVPAPFPNRRGELHTSIEDQVYQLAPYMDGDAFQPEIREQVAGAGSFLAKLHNALAEFAPTVEKRLPRYDDPAVMLAQLDRYMEEHKQQAPKSEWEQLVRIRSHASEILLQVPDSTYHALPKVVIHGDYHPANTAFKENGVCALFDFDWISLQPRVRDVADGIIYFSGVRPGGIDGTDIFSLTQSCSFEWGRIDDFLTAYNSNAAQPLQREEASAIPYLISARLINSRVQALTKIPANRHLEMLTAGMDNPLAWIEANRAQLTARG